LTEIVSVSLGAYLTICFVDGSQKFSEARHFIDRVDAAEVRAEHV